MCLRRLFFMAPFFLAVPACQTGSPEITPAASDAAATTTVGELELVDDHAKICMVNDKYMGKPQIPTTVAGKTYFGCRAGCKEKLETSEAARTAIDPVTHKAVDKASAVIGRDADGKVYYFESEASLRRYRAGP